MWKSQLRKLILGAAVGSCVGLILGLILASRFPKLVIGVPEESDRFHSKALECSMVVPKDWDVYDTDRRFKVASKTNTRFSRQAAISIESHGETIKEWKQYHSSIKFLPAIIGGYECLSARVDWNNGRREPSEPDRYGLTTYWLVQHRSRPYLITSIIQYPAEHEMDQLNAYVQTLRFD